MHGAVTSYALDTKAPNVRPHALTAYLQLLRPGNVVTAWADVLAGFAVAHSSNMRHAGLLIAATSCLYGGGVILNDFFDRGLDAVERPERPIPSGRVSSTAAGVFGFTCLAFGILCAGLIGPLTALTAIAISAFVLTYDIWAKHHKVGPVAMGACRGLNLVLGLSVVSGSLTHWWFLAFIPLVYIVAVTVLSRSEVHGGLSSTGFTAIVLLAGVVIALSTIAAMNQQWGFLFICFLTAYVAPGFVRAYRDPVARSFRSAVKYGVLGLVLLEASIAASFAGVWAGCLVALLMLPAMLLAKMFAVT
jgi:4-hydroxybenzoate polyprenyltransferase